RDEIAAMVGQPPHTLVEPPSAAMQRVSVVVEVGLEAFAVEREPAARDAVCLAADDRSEIERMVEIIVHPFEAEHERRVMAIEPQILNGGAIGDDAGAKPAAGDPGTLDRFAVLRLAETLDAHCFACHTGVPCRYAFHELRLYSPNPPMQTYLVSR